MNKSPTKRKRAAADVTPQLWRFTADQYQRMGEADIFRKEDHVELLEGAIYQMTPVGSWHNGGVDSLTMTLASALAGRAIVRVQGSFRLSPISEPQPDLVVLRYQPDFYRSALPGPQDVLFLVEVADASLPFDRGFKLPLYARDGIPEVWIVNRKDERVEVYREPQSGRYQQVVLNDRASTVTPSAFPDLSIHVAEILG